ncbi:MAG TPA: sigma-70 family RNA polymerase sigma factor [Balneolaceae bacterium]|nr:sigma-70 family RNA polymerase sigma factor [Balneolaceae bacterium]
MEKPGSGKTEKDLISDILAGNRNKYRIIIDRYSPMVFHIVRSFEKDEEEVKELGQQIFVKAYEKLDSFKGNAKFSTWLYSLALNHCRDYAKNIRRSNIRFSETEEGYLENSMIEEEKADSNIEAVEMNSALYNAIKRLSEEYSEPLLLKYRDGMSYQTISERLNVSVAALKVRVHRARKELKQLIEV